MRTNEPAVQKFGLPIFKTIVVLILFFGASFILNVSAANTIQKVTTQAEEANSKAEEMLKIIE